MASIASFACPAASSTPTPNNVAAAAPLYASTGSGRGLSASSLARRSASSLLCSGVWFGISIPNTFAAVTSDSDVFCVVARFARRFRTRISKKTTPTVYAYPAAASSGPGAASSELASLSFSLEAVRKTEFGVLILRFLGSGGCKGRDVIGDGSEDEDDEDDEDEDDDEDERRALQTLGTRVRFAIPTVRISVRDE